MKRTVKNNDLPKSLKWKKIGGGSLRFGNRIIKPNEIFEATLEEIPEAFRDTLICLEPEALQELQEMKEADMEINVDSFLIQSNGDKTFNVINAESKKPINKLPLSETSAQALLKSLTE